MRHIRPVVIALLLVGLVTGAGFTQYRSNALSDSIPTAAPLPDRYAVILVLDGTPYDQFDLSKMPNLAALAASGTTFTEATVGQLPSITETSHATIGTGVLPTRHGVLGDSWRAPGGTTMTPTLLDGNLIRTGYLEKLMQQAKVPSLAGIIHKTYKKSIVVSLSGHKTYAASAMSAGHADYVSFLVPGPNGHFVPGGLPGKTPDSTVLNAKQLDLSAYPRAAGVEDSWATTLAIKMVQRYQPRVMMINYPEPDNAGHTYGPDPKVILPIMESFDKDLGRLIAAYRAAGILSRTDFLVTSDHGMVGGTYSVDETKLSNIIKQAGGDPLLVGHGDYSAIWLKNPAARTRVATALMKASIPRVSGVFVKDAAGHYTLVPQSGKFHAAQVKGAYSDLLSTFDRPESADIVLTYEENTITMTPTFVKVGRKGDHEGATWGSQHIAFILSGPGVRSGYTSSYPVRFIDIAPTIETLLGATPKGQDGVPLADAMTNAPGPAGIAARAVQAHRTKDVQAMEKEATLTLAADYRP